MDFLKSTKGNTKKIAQLGLLIALHILLSYFLAINTPVLKISFGFLPLSIIGILYGPLTAGICAVITDLIGFMMFPGGSYFPGFTLTAFLTGFVYGFFLHNKSKSWVRILIASSIVCIILNLILNTYWLSILTGKGYVALLPTRIVKNIAMIPIQVVVINIIWNNFISKLKYFLK